MDSPLDGLEDVRGHVIIVRRPTPADVSVANTDLLRRWQMDGMGIINPTEQYGYVPSLSYGIIFVVLYSISTLLQLGETVYARRYWWMLSAVCGGILEIIGWAARIYAHGHPLNYTAYVMQIYCLIIAPTFYSAALYFGGGVAIAHVAPREAWIPTRWSKCGFLAADVISLVIQAVGGGIAGGAVGEPNNGAQIKRGSNIMLAGIVFQLAVMVFYVVYHVAWAIRARREIKLAGGRLQLMLLGLLLASAGIIARGSYRTPELAEGFDGWIATRQSWMLFDGIPISFAAFTLNVFHPAWFMRFSSEIEARNAQVSRYALDREATLVAEPAQYRDSLETMVEEPSHDPAPKQNGSCSTP
ncbi:hypothetical protein BMF94_0806 [Rhodotorula taiwanensis]|uniref:Uncharacterized protein n=1 Tax=Rhodotorula taiwanensis TaxID=741276 RepID=A0A2S5BH57_9BASI|nr:hypothetical protein BMF94_0806 [Rhodotorula taiwanensis]